MLVIFELNVLARLWVKMHSELIDRTIGEIVKKKNACMQHAILYCFCCVPKLDHLGGCTICIVMRMQQLADTGVAYHASSLGFCKTSGLEVFAVKMVELKIIISCFFPPNGYHFFMEREVWRGRFSSGSRSSGILIFRSTVRSTCRPTSGPEDCVSYGLTGYSLVTIHQRVA